MIKPRELDYAPPPSKRNRKLMVRLIVLVIGLSFMFVGLILHRNAHELIVIVCISIGMIATLVGIFGALRRMGELQDEANKRDSK